jgi:hypothetical protein
MRRLMTLLLIVFTTVRGEGVNLLKEINYNLVKSVFKVVL